MPPKGRGYLQGGHACGVPRASGVPQRASTTNVSASGRRRSGWGRRAPRTAPPNEVDGCLNAPLGRARPRRNERWRSLCPRAWSGRDKEAPSSSAGMARLWRGRWRVWTVGERANPSATKSPLCWHCNIEARFTVSIGCGMVIAPDTELQLIEQKRGNILRQHASRCQSWRAGLYVLQCRLCPF